MKRKIIVYFLNTGESKIYGSMEELLNEIKSITAGRVEYCIKTGRTWKTMAFDEVAE